MAMFRRRSTSSGPQADETPTDTPAEPTAEGAQDTAADGPEGTDPDQSATVGGVVDAPLPAYDRARGPFDASEMEQADSDLVRLDLGSLLIPGLPGVGVQVEADPNTQQVRAITGVLEDAAVQLQVFAAPRSEGLWDEIRAGMLAEITGTDKAQVLEASGPFGPELRAVMPARSPEGKAVMQPLRFVGIDGPRWFLRAVFLGRAAAQPDSEDQLHELVRQTIVVRGTEAMAPQDPLPLRLPEQPVPADGADVEDGADEEELSDAAAEQRYADLDPFERGPEITETR